MRNQLQIGSMLNPRDRCQAVQWLKDGNVLAAQFLTVYGLVADANQPKAVQSLLRAKGKPARTPLAAMLPPTLLPKLADFECVTEPFRTILKEPALMNRYYRLPHFLQIPVKSQADLPEVLITPGDGHNLPGTIINIWFPGYRPVDQLLTRAVEEGITIACTSLNYRHYVSVSKAKEADEFCRNSSELVHLLTDDYAARKVVPLWSGSYSILSTVFTGNDRARQNLLREGNISQGTFEALYNCYVSSSGNSVCKARPLQFCRKDIETLLQFDDNYRAMTDLLLKLESNGVKP